MTTPTHRITAILALSLGCLLSAGTVAAPPPLVVFGDSLSDTGNKLAVRQILTQPPYGELNPFGVPSDAYDEPGENFTNGSTWIEIVAEALDTGKSAGPVLGHQQHAELAGNYAWGGAHAGQPLLPDGNRHLGEQVQSYLADVNHDVSAETLHVVLIGGNDVIEALVVLGSNPPASFPAAVGRLQAAVDSLHANLTALQQAGARRILLLTLPDVSLAPAIPAAGKPVTSCFVQAVNQPGPPLAPCPFIALTTSIREIAASLAADGVAVTLVDAAALLDAINAEPAAFGFTADRNEPCIRPPMRCEEPNRHLFWDGVHPSAALHRLLGAVVTSRLEI